VRRLRLNLWFWPLLAVTLIAGGAGGVAGAFVAGQGFLMVVHTCVVLVGVGIAMLWVDRRRP
jgi:hypothetical protein